MAGVFPRILDDEIVDRYERDHDDDNSIMAKALADCCAEAFAEHLHMRVRKEFWGYAPGESLDTSALIQEEYRGIRPAPGYAACPDHTAKGTLFDLMDAPKQTGIQLTESFAMMPAASVSGYYFSHPNAAYFGLGRIGRDQVEDYAENIGCGIGRGRALARTEPRLRTAGGSCVVVITPLLFRFGWRIVGAPKGQGSP